MAIDEAIRSGGIEIPFGSKYFGWLASLAIVLISGWYLLPSGYNTLILWLAPQLGNYIRPTLVMVNALLLNPLNNPIMTAIWAAAGLVGGMIAGTKKGAFVVGLFTWLSCIVLLAFCVIQVVLSGVELGTLPPIPQGESILNILTVPLVQTLITDIFGIIAGSGGGSIDPATALIPILVYIIVPVVIAVVSAIVGATIRKKE
ncbi:MAG: hypothetical protein QXS20_04765 [Candidatus Thorarchaeota archaeon]